MQSKTKYTHTFSYVRKGLSIDDVGVVEGHRFSGDTTGGGAGFDFKTGDFVEEKLGGGAAVERLTGACARI